MENGQAVVETMIEQHKELVAIAGSILELAGKKDRSESRKICDLLEQFSLGLAEHLKLENEIFYVELIKNMHEKGEDTVKTEEFISKIKEIEKAVTDFLFEYDSAEKVSVSIEKFDEDVRAIFEVLSLRIESEESGVYSY